MVRLDSRQGEGIVNSATWLSLTDYSTKYRVSVSTLRRRIKSNDVPFEFRDGKYLLKDKAQSLHRWHRPSLDICDEEIVAKHRPSLEQNKKEESAPAVLETANRMINELKSAYDLALKEKQEQILSLKGELVGLRTLVSVLESENGKLKKAKLESAFSLPHHSLK